jgi:hypothetical protein
MAETKKGVFATLNAINVNDHTEVKDNGTDKLTYLSWVWAWQQVKTKYPDVSYEVKHWDGKPFLYEEALGYMVETSVTIQGETMTMWLPVMDSKNKAMKAQPYSYKTKYGEKWVNAATMFDINTTIMRCLVKNLAMFGLGLYIYAGEDLPQEEKEQQANAMQAKIEEACAAMRAVTSREEMEACWKKYSKVVPSGEGSDFMNAIKEVAPKFPKQQ